MADSAEDPLADLVKRATNNLAKKIPDLLVLLLSNKYVGSIGAGAGFALALVFAWRLTRSPARTTRRKRTGVGSAVNSRSEIYRQLVSLRESEVFGGMQSPAELSLVQIVKKKLNGGRKITCQLFGIILEERSSKDLQKHATVKLSVVDILHELTKFCDVYLMETVDSDASEEQVLEGLERAGLFRPGMLVKEKVLFCSTENGRTSFVRQLEPDWHIDTSADVVLNLARFIRYQLHISEATSGVLASNVFTSESLDQYFSRP